MSASLNIAALVFITKWTPSPDSLLPYFIVMGIWGVGDGIWVSQANILMGALFPGQYEEAFAGLRVAQGLGAAVSFGYSNSLCMYVKTYILGGICIVAVLGHLAAEWLVKRKAKAKVVMMKQTSV